MLSRQSQLASRELRNVTRIAADAPGTTRLSLPLQLGIGRSARR